MIVQFSTVQLWSAITGIRPGILLLQKISLPDDSLGKRKRAGAFQSDLPKYVTLKDLPDWVCYLEIELFYLKDPQNKRDVPCAVLVLVPWDGGGGRREGEASPGSSPDQSFTQLVHFDST